jgi:hypothetical protein
MPPYLRKREEGIPGHCGAMRAHALLRARNGAGWRRVAPDGVKRCHPVLARAGLIPPRVKGAKPWQCQAAPKDGFHVLRHTHASLVPEAGKEGRGAIDSLLGSGARRGLTRTPQVTPQDRS